MAKEKTLFKVLICDDDPQDRKLIQAYLQQQTDREIVVLEAGQIADIQSALENGRVDLVLMDIEMPEKSGTEWLREIVLNQVAPVIMLTGYGNEEIAAQSIQMGAVGYLPKSGLSPDKLLSAVDGALKKWRELRFIKASEEQLEKLANIDFLTGLSNRRVVLYRLEELLKQARRHRDNFSVIMLDIDHFKKINDVYGHLTGDQTIERIAQLLRIRTRDLDVVGRYGGDEFVIILPRTDLPCALLVAERIRKSIEATKITDLKGNVFNITVSQGLVSYKLGDDIHSIVSRADNALYRAKAEGRNRVETYELIASGIQVACADEANK